MFPILAIGQFLASPTYADDLQPLGHKPVRRDHFSQHRNLKEGLRG